MSGFTGDMGLMVPYKPPIRPNIVPLSVPFRVFQQYLSKTEMSVTHKQFVDALKKYPDAADSLGLLGWIKQSNASLQIWQLLFGLDDYNEEKDVTLGDLFRVFSGQQIEDLGLCETYTGPSSGVARPDYISAQAAISAFHQMVPISRSSITHIELIDGMKADKNLAQTLGFKKTLEDENGSHVVYMIM
jgi:hypothetical protein